MKKCKHMNIKAIGAIQEDGSVSYIEASCKDCEKPNMSVTKELSRKNVKITLSLPETKTTKGTKHDNSKADLSLIPLIAEIAMAEAFMVGAKKYSRYNYYAGLAASRLIAAAKRHLSAWMNGEERCPVDGQHHLGSAMACCAMILKLQELGTLEDDRYKP
jgi:hypothetical protein